MNRTWLESIRPWAPPALARWYRRRFGWQWFRGDFADWQAAQSAAAGYAEAAVLARVQAAMREVQAGRAAWERDGVAFAAPAVNQPLLDALRQAAQETGGRLTVIDFGGSLGSTWWQHRAALADLPAMQWRVVEQPHYVSAGREFAGEALSFHDSIGAALGSDQPAVILLSSVLPYVESPRALLDEVVRREFRHVIIDRTPLGPAGRTRLAVQHTPPGLGGGSYPCWLFDRGQLLAPLQANYELAREWPALDRLAADVHHRGFHFVRHA